MSRTKRNIPGYFSKTRANWDSGFVEQIHNGLVAMPKGNVFKSGNIGNNEIWGQDAKKYAKRLRNRFLRRKNKKIEIE